MNAVDKAPHYIMVDFLRPTGEAVCLTDLGVAFMKAQAIPPGNGPLAFRIAVEKKISKAGNAFYDITHPVRRELQRLLRLRPERHSIPRWPVDHGQGGGRNRSDGDASSVTKGSPDQRGQRSSHGCRDTLYGHCLPD